MKKRKRQKNNRVLRKISHILLIAALFHYVPAFLRQSGMPYTETVYGWIVTYIYNGVPGMPVVLEPGVVSFHLFSDRGAFRTAVHCSAVSDPPEGADLRDKKAEKTLSLVQERGRIQRRYHTAFLEDQRASAVLFPAVRQRYGAGGGTDGAVQDHLRKQGIL